MAESETAGTFTCTLLQKTIAKIDQIWADNATQSDYDADVELLRALRAEQTASFEELKNPDKDKTMRVWWLQDCSTGVSTCADDAEDCEFSGPEVESKCQDYALDICAHVSFSIEDNVFRTNEADASMALAKAMAARMKELDNYFAQSATAKLDTFAGTNQYTGGIGTVSGVTTYIPSNFWGPDIYGYFNLVKVKNKFKNAFMIHGENLNQWMWQAEFNNQNANNKDQKPKLSSIRSYWDLFNVDMINEGEKISYMVDKGSVAVVNKARYPLNNPKTYQFGKRWSIESKALPGVYYDVYYKERCAMVDGEEKIYHDYKIKLRAGVFLNPTGCNEDKTGVLRFACGTAPAES